MPYDPTIDVGKVRMLINDINDARPIFTDPEITTLLELEGGRVKRAAAQALDTIADNEALRSKVIRTQDVGTDGAKVADSLRKRAAALRAQDDTEKQDEAGFAFQIIPFSPRPARPPELTEWPRW